MRTTVTVDDKLLTAATEHSGLKSKSDVLNEALKWYVAREAGKRLAAMGGTEPDFVAPPRRRLPAE